MTLVLMLVVVVEVLLMMVWTMAIVVGWMWPKGNPTTMRYSTVPIGSLVV
jgi:hypothetical protein